MNYAKKNREEYEVQEISIDEFDKISQEHQFSEDYERRKGMLIKDYKESRANKVKRVPFRVAVAVASICVIGTVGVYAAVAHRDFFGNAFGNSGRESVTSFIQMQDNGEKGMVPVQVPAKEYVSVNPEIAEKEIGQYVMSKPITKKYGEHTLTILSAVRSDSAMVMEFTLERKGGENSLVYNDLTNVTKGAYSSDKADFCMVMNEGFDCIYVDKNKSTDERLHCYDYIVFDKPLAEGKSPSLEIEFADKPLLELKEGERRYAYNLEIPVTKVSPSVKYVSKEGGVAEISALGINIDLSKGLGLDEDEAYDPGSLDSVKVNNTDGTAYVVFAENVDNEGYTCTFDTIYKATFNRLVEPDKVQSIEVNGITYQAE